MFQNIMFRIALSATDRECNFDEHVSNSSYEDSVKINAMTRIFPYVCFNRRKDN